MSIYDVNIDFDESSKLWRQNKIRMNNGFYKYICCAINKNGKICNNKPNYNFNYCFRHLYFIKDNDNDYDKILYKSTKNHYKCIMICKNGKKCERLRMNGLNYCFSHNIKIN